MHELSVALSILEFAEEEADRRGAVIEAIHIKLGALSGVVKQALISAYDLARESTSLGACRLVIEDVPIVIYCGHCRGDRRIASAQCVYCPDCGLPPSEFIQGRELQVVG